MTWIGLVCRGSAALVALLILVPFTASAQQGAGSVAGEVADDTGGVLPGVTIEAASPALIEGVRTAFTDGEGRYNIINLVPGTYSITFTLPGFATIIREGVELTSNFTSTINAAMQVGGIEETITVTGASPLVDVQNVRQQTAIQQELRSELPSGTMNMMTITRLVPGMTSGTDPGGGGATGLYSSNQSTAANFHGKAGSKQTYDGMQTNNLSGEGSTSYTMNPSTVEETTVETGGINAESNASGLLINMIPKDGGNTFSFGSSGTFTNESLQTSAVSDTLKERGLTTASKVLRAYDAHVTVGGPIRRDRLWFFAATRFTGTKNQPAGLFFNATRGTPIYTPDLDKPQFAKEWLQAQSMRITWQASQTNKITGFVDPQLQIRRGGGNAAPEAQGCLTFWPQGLYQAAWTSTMTTRLLIEAGTSLTKGPFPCTREDTTDQFGFTVAPTDVSILERSTGFRYNASRGYRDRNDHDRYAERFAVSYVTGSHNFKTGMQLQQHVHNQLDVTNSDGRNLACPDCDVRYQFTNGVPTRIELWATPYLRQHRTQGDLGLFVQDQWTVDRMTLNLGLRFDYYKAKVLAQEVPAGDYLPARSFESVPDVPEWTDLNPRLGMSYDLSGTGQTAIKASLGRYVGRETLVYARANNPISTSINNVNRNWNDANGNFIPDCDLRNFDSNGECGPIDNENFGKSNPGAVQFADDLIRGHGVRDYFWDVAAEVQHELSAGVSVKAGYYRNWSDHFGAFPRGENTVGVTDNLAVTPEDFDEYCITAPVDSRLPGGGGNEICGLYDVRPDKFGQGELLVARASSYGDGKSRVSDFVTVSINSRFGTGAEVGASLDMGRTVEDHCFTVDSPQNQVPDRAQGTRGPQPKPVLDCRVVNPFGGQTQIKAHMVYPLPGGFQVSAIFENLSGAPHEAYLNVRNDDIAPSLGRNLAACGTRTVCTSTARVPLVQLFSQREPRRTLLDLRLSKAFDVGDGALLRANFDLYNALNSSALLRLNNNYGSAWLQPVGTSGAAANRLIQVGGQLQF